MKRMTRRGGILLSGAIGILVFTLFKLAPQGDLPETGVMRKASEAMASAERAVRECREGRGMAPDPTTDINRTGLIGIETSLVTTTLGSLEAKRTTTNPNFAGLVARLLGEAGVRPGDAVAIGGSGSFPALILAAISAARALDAEPRLIFSLGASQWGANDPRFDGLDILDCLERVPGAAGTIVALTVGGDEDRGSDLGPEGRRYLAERIRLSGCPSFDEPDLERNVALRLRLYAEAASGRRIGAFVNIGGSWANIGTNAEVLKLRPGLVSDAFVPPPDERGVLQAMAENKVPAIHLLNIHGLCERYGLPWDPSPLPAPGEGSLYGRAAGGGAWIIALFLGYALIVAIILVFSARRRSPKRHP